MTAVFKEPGRFPTVVELPRTKAAAEKKLGGKYQAYPCLRGAMILCREDDAALPFNIHFMGDVYRGPILMLGRDGDKPVDLSEQLCRTLLKALHQKEDR